MQRSLFLALAEVWLRLIFAKLVATSYEARKILTVLMLFRASTSREGGAFSRKRFASSAHP